MQRITRPRPAALLLAALELGVSAGCPGRGGDPTGGTTTADGESSGAVTTGTTTETSASSGAVTTGAVGACGAYAPDEVLVGDKPGVTVEGDDALAQLSGVRCVVANYLKVLGVTTVEPLAALERIEGGFTLANSPELTNIEALGGLSVVTDYFVLDGLPKLGSLAGLDALSHVGSLQIGTIGTVATPGPIPGRGNDALVDLTGLAGLSAASHIVIGDNDALVSLAGLGVAPAGAAVVQIVNNPQLPTDSATVAAELWDDDGDGVLVCGNLEGEPCVWQSG